MTPSSNTFFKLSLIRLAKSSTNMVVNMRWLPVLLILSMFDSPVFATDDSLDKQREQFKSAWHAARRGDHASFYRVKDGLQDYLLYPYLQYEDYRNRRAMIGTREMVAFLDGHRDWAFEPGLRRAWLKSLARRGRWSDLLAHSNGNSDTALKCQQARARIILEQTSGIEAEIQKLWLAGHSQPDECDVAFTWLINTHGIPESLAWQRIYLAMAENNRCL